MFHVTERLLLRPVWPEDWEGIFGVIADAAVVRNLARAPWPYKECDAKAFAMREHDAMHPNFLLTLPTSEGSHVIGAAGIGPIPERNDGAVELGYWIARPHWGQGYATEAAQGVIEVARMLGHERLEASHHFDNPASGKVLRKLGFRPTGVIERRFSAGRGEDVDGPVYELDLAGQASWQMPFAA